MSVELLYGKTTVCNKMYSKPGMLLPIPSYLNGPWFTVREERRWQEEDAGNVRCLCRVSSVEAVLTE
jgi:hypothetical protein